MSRPINHLEACLLAGAVGDALAAPHEGTVGVAVRALPALGQITDDTALTLATCEGILAARALDPACIAEAFVAWYRKGDVVGVGSSTLKALRDLAAGAHWALSGAQGEYAAGNGGAMRIAPVVFIADLTNSQHLRLLRHIVRITHRSDEAYVGALAVAYAIRSASSQSVGSFVALAHEQIPDSAVRDRLQSFLNDGPLVSQVVLDHGTSGHVVASVPLALYLADQRRDASLLEIIEEVSSFGGDTDTIAAMSCQILGALHGPSWIHEACLERFVDVDRVQTIVRAFGRWCRTAA